MVNACNEARHSLTHTVQIIFHLNLKTCKLFWMSVLPNGRSLEMVWKNLWNGGLFWSDAKLSCYFRPILKINLTNLMYSMLQGSIAEMQKINGMFVVVTRGTAKRNRQ